MVTKKPESADGAATRSAEAKPLCFVVGPIGTAGTPERKHADKFLKGVVREALEPLGYEVKRADDDPRPGMIGDRMIQDVLTADLVVADLTFLNPNAFYELGVRHCTKKPTIHFALAGTKLPFDNVGHDAIFADLDDWDQLIMARERIAASANSTTLPSYRVSNPVTQSNLTFELRNSDDPKDAALADLRESVENLSAELSEMKRREQAMADAVRINIPLISASSIGPHDTTSIARRLSQIAFKRSALSDLSFISPTTIAGADDAYNDPLARRTE